MLPWFSNRLDSKHVRPRAAFLSSCVRASTYAKHKYLLMIPSVAMLHFPTVMRKAQAELDSNVGHDRLPEFYDRQNLPYINAIINETLRWTKSLCRFTRGLTLCSRWRPVAILGGTPHQVVADDVYKGM